MEYEIGKKILLVNIIQPTRYHAFYGVVACGCLKDFIHHLLIAFGQDIEGSFSFVPIPDGNFACHDVGKCIDEQ